LALVQEPMKPKLTLDPADRLPFHDALRAVTLAPVVVSADPQAWLIVWPLANVQVTTQDVMDDVPAVTLTSPWKPPGH
jgi:hypothetical protein